jgi:hypothetical protein
LRRQLFADRSLIDLAKNPLLLTIIAVAHKFKERLPQRRLDVYREIFQLLLEDRPYQRQTRLTIANAAENQTILQPLALALTKANRTQFKPHQGAACIQKRLARMAAGTALTPEKFLVEIQQVSGLLAGGESYLYEFTHKTFQEYLAAVELTQHASGGQEMMSRLADENWKEVVYFYALLTNPVPFIEKALETPDATHTLELAQRIANDAKAIGETLKQKLLEARQHEAPESAEVRLAQRFQTLTRLTDQIAISDGITWGEYQLFIEKQVEQAFHSWADTATVAATEHRSAQRVDNEIAWEDARWFCAWLSTQPNLAPDDGVYDYRLPTPQELSALSRNAQSPSLTPQAPWTTVQPWTTDPTQPGNALRVVRQRLPERYRELVNYLASGSWQEADQETYQLMLKAVGEQAEQRGYLDLEEIRNFPCEDLLLMDQLWVKFSGGKFGFSVQKQIWVEVGGKLDFGQDTQAAIAAFEKMSDRNGWRRDGNYIASSQVTFDTSAPTGHLPKGFGVEGLGGVGAWGGSLASRLVNCSR